MVLREKTFPPPEPHRLSSSFIAARRISAVSRSLDATSSGVISPASTRLAVASKNRAVRNASLQSSAYIFARSSIRKPYHNAAASGG